VAPLSSRAGLRRWCLTHAGIGPGITHGGDSEPGQVVGPAGDVPGLLGGRQVAMFEVDPGTGAFGGDPHFHRAGTGGQAV
jgi:hypothetical protein